MNKSYLVNRDRTKKLLILNGSLSLFSLGFAFAPIALNHSQFISVIIAVGGFMGLMQTLFK